MMGFEHEQCLYSNIQSVVMPNGKTRDLRIDVSGCGKPVTKVEVRLTDDADPSLLYILHVSECDFNVIKSQQGLLVDFSNFPVHLVKLFEQCMNSVKGFLLTLEENGLENYLKVVQPIDLKNLCYIALRIARGSDSEVMRHMHSQITLMKKKLNVKEEECESMQSQIVQLQQELSFKDKQNEKQLKQWEEEQSRLKAQFSKEMDILREQLLQDKKRDLDSAAYQRESLSTKVEDLSRDVAKYKNKHLQISEKYEQAQQTIRELTLRISSSEEAQKAMNRELSDLRQRKAELEGDCRKRRQDIDQAHVHAEALDKEVTRLRARLNRQEGQLRQADAEQVRLKTAFSRLQETLEARNDLVLQLNGDLNKANLIIKERQKELDKIHNEMQRLLSLKKEGEHKLTNLELEMKLLRANAERDQARVKVLEEEGKELQEQLQKAKEAISEKDEQHKKCGELITYLNRSLNRQQLDPSPPSTGHGPAAFYNSAPSAPILYTMGSSMGRAGAGGGLHMSGPPITNPQVNGLVNALPFSSTPLVASAAAGGTAFTARRSFPGAMVQQSGQALGNLSHETPASRPIVDRITLSQLQAREESQPKRKGHSPPHSTLTQDKQKTLPKARSSTSIEMLSKVKKNERALKGQSDKENKGVAPSKPSAYFQPNKIRTEF